MTAGKYGRVREPHRGVDEDEEDDEVEVELGAFVHGGGASSQGVDLEMDEDEDEDEDEAIEPAEVVPTMREELVAQSRLSLPVTINMLAYRVPWVVSIMFVGRLGQTPLAAASMASTLGNVSGLSVLVGLSSALTTLGSQVPAGVTHHVGADPRDTRSPTHACTHPPTLTRTFFAVRP
jgi:hypothetical protein